MNTTPWLPYVYRVTHKTSGQFYIGMRSVNKVIAEKDLGIKYFTSNKLVKANFDKFDIEILAYFIDQESAFYFENSLIEENFKNELLLNKQFQRSFSTFSMAGFKRLDLVKQNASKKKPKELRTYICAKCESLFSKLEFIHREPLNQKYCSVRCSVQGRPNPNKGKSLPHLHSRTSWNKGLPNPTAADNARKGAAKQSATVTGRKKKFLEDGSWTWEYLIEAS